MRVIIVHGTGGSPNSNWFPWLATELRTRGVEVHMPQFPTPEDQSLDAWLEVFDGAIGVLNSNDILVGHSIGAAFVCRVLERAQTKVKAAFFVAGFARQLGNPQFDPFNKTFLEAPFDWSAIRNNAEFCFAVSGENDPYVPLGFGKELAGALGVDLIVIPGGGHLNAESGFNEFPRLLSEMEDKRIV